MKSGRKLKILSSEEMKQEVAGTQDPQTEKNCAVAEVCPGGIKKLECSGTDCVVTNKTVDGNIVLVSLKCYDKFGQLLYSGFCDDSDTGEGEGGDDYSGVNSGTIAACSGADYGDSCSWKDEHAGIHYGQCRYAPADRFPHSTLYCFDPNSSHK